MATTTNQPQSRFAVDITVLGDSEVGDADVLRVVSAASVAEAEALATAAIAAVSDGDVHVNRTTEV